MYHQQANQGKLFSTVRGAHAEQQEAALRLVEADLRTAWKDLKEEWDHFEKHLIEIGMMVKSTTSCGEENMVSLNVGGELVHVHRGMFEGQRFGDLFKGVWDERVPRDAAGCMVLDESPACVQHLVRMLLASCLETRLTAPSPLGDDLPAHERAHLDYVSHVLGLVPLQGPLRAKTDIVVQPSKGMVALGQGSSLRSHELAQLMRDLRRWCPGEFRRMELMYNSSRDGMEADAFHSKCDGGGCSTLTLVKASKFQRERGWTPITTIGGFSTASWAARPDGGCHFLHSAEAFLFAMKDKGLVKYDLREGHADCAIYCGPNLGPCFGASDIHLTFVGNRKPHLRTGNQSYKVPDGSTFLGTGAERRVDIIEVFRVHHSEVSAPSPASPAIPTPSTTDDVRCGINAVPEEMADDAHRFGVSIASSLMGERVVLQQSQAELARAQEMASAALEALTNVYGPDIASGNRDEVVELSVRGVRMTTLRSTLTVCPGSVFTTWFNGNWKPTEKDLDKHGRRVLDCKPTVFAKVLDVLRMKKRAGWAPSEDDAGAGGVAAKPVPVAVRRADRAYLEEFVNKYFPGCERFIMDSVVELPTAVLNIIGDHKA